MFVRYDTSGLIVSTNDLPAGALPEGVFEIETSLPPGEDIAKYQVVNGELHPLPPDE